MLFHSGHLRLRLLNLGLDVTVVEVNLGLSPVDSDLHLGEGADQLCVAPRESLGLHVELLLAELGLQPPDFTLKLLNLPIFIFEHLLELVDLETQLPALLFQLLVLTQQQPCLLQLHLVPQRLLAQQLVQLLYTASALC